MSFNGAPFVRALLMIRFLFERSGKRTKAAIMASKGTTLYDNIATVVGECYRTGMVGSSGKPGKYKGQCQEKNGRLNPAFDCVGYGLNRLQDFMADVYNDRNSKAMARAEDEVSKLLDSNFAPPVLAHFLNGEQDLSQYVPERPSVPKAKVRETAFLLFDPFLSFSQKGCWRF
jgi:hypothetical protein